MKSQRHSSGYLDFVSRHLKQRQRTTRAKSMEMVNHQRDRLALFLDAAPGHKLSKGLARSGQAVKPDLYFAAALSLLRGCY